MERKSHVFTERYELNPHKILIHSNVVKVSNTRGNVLERSLTMEESLYELDNVHDSLYKFDIGRFRGV